MFMQNIRICYDEIRFYLNTTLNNVFVLALAPL